MAVPFLTHHLNFLQPCFIVLYETLLMKQLDEDPEGPSLQFGGVHYYENHWGKNYINKCHYGGRIRYCHIIQGFQTSL